MTYIISGAIEHKDNMGNGTVISAGEIQRMTAGTGIEHSEFNHSQDDELHLLQIWLFPEEKGLVPGYEQIEFTREDKLNQLKLVGSRDGRSGSVTIHQKVDLYASVLEAGTELTHTMADTHKVFVQVISGNLTISGKTLAAGDGVQIKNENSVLIIAQSEAEILLFDMD